MHVLVLFRKFSSIFRQFKLAHRAGGFAKSVLG